MENQAKRSCVNCKRRYWNSMFGREYCYGYEVASGEEELIKTAMECEAYEKEIPSDMEDEDYCPSATARDYSPSSPWDAPGMSVKDFI